MVWIQMINNLAKNPSNDQKEKAQEVLAEFNQHGNYLTSNPLKDIQLYEDIYNLTQKYNLIQEFDLLKKQWFYHVLNRNIKIYHLTYNLLKNDNNKLNELITNCGLSTPDTQLQILGDLYYKRGHENLRSHILDHLPQIETINRFQNINLLLQLYRNKINEKSMGLRILNQLLFCLTNNKFNDWVTEFRKIISVTNELSVLASNSKENYELLHNNFYMFAQKIHQINQPSHRYTFLEMSKLINKRGLIDRKQMNEIAEKFQFDELRLDVSQLLKSNNDISNDEDDLNTFIKRLSLKDQKSRFQYLLGLSKQENNIGKLLQLTNSDYLKIQLISILANNINEYHGELIASVKNLQTLDPFIFYSLYFILGFSNNQELNDLIIDLIEKTKQSFHNNKEDSMYVLNIICDDARFKKKDYLFNEILKDMFQQVEKFEPAQIERVYHIIDILRPDEKDFNDIQQKLKNAVLNNIQLFTENALVSIVFYIVSIYKHYGWNIEEFKNPIKEKLISMIEVMRTRSILFLYSHLQSFEDVSHQNYLINKTVHTRIQTEQIRNVLVPFINYVSTKIKIEECSHESAYHIDLIIEEMNLQLKNEEVYPKNLLREFSNLILKVERHNPYKKEILRQIHQQLFIRSQQKEIITDKHILLACIMCQHDESIFEKIQLQKISNFDLISIYHFLLETQSFKSTLYSLFRKEIQRRDNLFQIKTERKEMGFLTKLFISAGLDKDIYLITRVMSQFAPNLEEIIDDQLKQPAQYKIKKQFNQDRKDQIPIVTAVQYYQTAIIIKMRFNYNHKLFDKIIKDLLPVVSKIHQMSLSSSSNLEHSVYQHIRAILPEEEIVKEYGEIKPFVIDLYLPSRKIGIECDGVHHYIDGKLKLSEILRDQIIEKQGIRMVRIQTEEWMIMSIQTKQQILKDILGIK